mmetsp:Transcript_24187/g.52666  ORF Transcript_24187/g.52666 Transcript_24187/m.52666 type:complete len:288 (-) Transcript_24187:39-902(-)
MLGRYSILLLKCDTVRLSPIIGHPRFIINNIVHHFLYRLALTDARTFPPSLARSLLGPIDQAFQLPFHFGNFRPRRRHALVLPCVEATLHDPLHWRRKAGRIVAGISLDLVSRHALRFLQVRHVFVDNQDLPHVAAFVVRGMIERFEYLHRTGEVHESGRIGHSIAPEGPLGQLLSIQQRGAANPVQVEDVRRRCLIRRGGKGGSGRYRRHGTHQRSRGLLGGLLPRLPPSGFLLGGNLLVQRGHLIPQGCSEGWDQDAQDQHAISSVSMSVVVGHGQASRGYRSTE